MFCKNATILHLPRLIDVIFRVEVERPTLQGTLATLYFIFTFHLTMTRVTGPTEEFRQRVRLTRDYTRVRHVELFKKGSKTN